MTGQNLQPDTSTTEDMETKKDLPGKMFSERLLPSKAMMNYALLMQADEEQESTESSESQSQQPERTSLEEKSKNPRVKKKLVKKAITHLRMQGRSLRAIPSFNTCPNIVVLYLYNNRIEKIQNLEILSQLTHLYLSHNNIQRLENLSSLQRLQKLYITHNKLSVLEGLEKLENLREVHMSHQKIPAEDGLVFDPRSIAALRSSLKILDVSHCRVTSIRALSPLLFLQELSVKENSLESLVDVRETVSKLPSLIRLEIKGNPLCKLQRYKDSITESAPFLQDLDGFDVTSSFRQFLAGREAVVAAVSRRQSLASYNPAAESMPPEETAVGYSASADAINRTVDAAVTEPRSAISYGNLPPLERAGESAFTSSSRRRTRLQPARHDSSTHVRVGNMLTLTRQQRMAVRMAASDRQLTPDPSSGDFDHYSFVQPAPCPSLPHCPARVPVREVVSSAEVAGKHQPLHLTPW